MKFNKFTKKIRKTVQSYLKGYKKGWSSDTVDVCMDIFLVDACAQTIGDRLEEQRDNGRGGWWNEKVCPLSNLSRMASDNAENGEYLDAAILYLMMYMRVAGGIEESPRLLHKNGCVTNLRDAVEALNSESKKPARLSFYPIYAAVPLSQVDSDSSEEGSKIRFTANRDVVLRSSGLKLNSTKALDILFGDCDILFDDWVVVPATATGDYQEEESQK